MLIDGAATVEGGQQTRRVRPSTAAEWCDEYGVRVVDGIAEVYKGVGDNYRSDRGADYTPGTVPVSTDWDGGHAECGGGYHFSPSAAHTLEFASGATKFLKCFVALSDIRAPQDADSYPNKIKARGCVKPCVEVDIDGNEIVTQKAVA